MANPTGINQYTKGGATAGTRKIVGGMKAAQSTYSPKSPQYKKLGKSIKGLTATIGGKTAYKVPGTGGSKSFSNRRTSSVSKRFSGI